MALLTVNDENFKSAVLESELPVVVDFYATWCGFCKRISPVIDHLAEKYDGKVHFAKANTDETPELNVEFAIDLVPTLFLFINGERSKPLTNPSSEAAIEEWLKAETEKQ